MSVARNPAGRLHAFLLRFHEVSRDGNASIGSSWAAALDVEASDLGSRLVKMAALLANTEDAIQRDGRSSLVRQQVRWGDAWYDMVLFPSQSLAQAASHVMNYAAVDSLEVVSDLLDVSSGSNSLVREITDDDEVDLRRAVEDALHVLREDESLPDELKRLFSHRLHDMTRALDDLAFGGAESVQIIAERIAARLPTSEKGRPPAVSALFNVLGIVFKYGPPIVSAAAALSGSPMASAIGWEPMLAIESGESGTRPPGLSESTTPPHGASDDEGLGDG
ncbi:hypothetical protein WDZ17_00915 [Pseudokineococcus basanitobsidens]|uniref:Uncharacterized protein n=1 Tax=Pseudokineococcus basanitobsidens TaxID=1926649 RepID=A0ABU8RFK7_9ACTN